MLFLFIYFQHYYYYYSDHPKHRLADALYVECYRAARERGAKVMLLNCTPALCPYYEKLGFVRYVVSLFPLSLCVRP